MVCAEELQSLATNREMEGTATKGSEQTMVTSVHVDMHNDRRGLRNSCVL